MTTRSVFVYEYFCKIFLCSKLYPYHIPITWLGHNANILSLIRDYTLYVKCAVASNILILYKFTIRTWEHSWGAGGCDIIYCVGMIIYLVSDSSENINRWSLTKIRGKYFIMPHEMSQYYFFINILVYKLIGFCWFAYCMCILFIMYPDKYPVYSNLSNIYNYVK